jgi:hypothetical protein
MTGKIMVPLSRVIAAYNACPIPALARVMEKAHVSEFLDEQDVLLLESVEFGKVRFLGRSNERASSGLRRTANGGHQGVL